jgi:hypothetical protein
MKQLGIKQFVYIFVCIFSLTMSGCGGGDDTTKKKLGQGESQLAAEEEGSQQGIRSSGKEDESAPIPQADEPPPQTLSRDVGNTEAVQGQQGVTDMLDMQSAGLGQSSGPVQPIYVDAGQVAGVVAGSQVGSDIQGGNVQPPPNWVLPAEEKANEWRSYFKAQLKKKSEPEAVQLLESTSFFSDHRAWLVQDILDLSGRTIPGSQVKLSPVRYYHNFFACLDLSGNRSVTGFYIKFMGMKNIDDNNYMLPFYLFTIDDCAKGDVERKRTLSKGTLQFNSAKSDADLNSSYNGLLVQHPAAPIVRARVAVGREVNKGTINNPNYSPDLPGKKPYNLLMITIEGMQLGSTKIGNLFLKHKVKR